MGSWHHHIDFLNEKCYPIEKQHPSLSTRCGSRPYIACLRFISRGD